MLNSITIPDHVRTVVAELAVESSSREIWLIGSRATGNHHLESDWDLLLFSSEEPVATNRRSENVDVLHGGPSGAILLEGQPTLMQVRFESFRWRRTGPFEAEYQGLRFLDVPSGVARDSDEPSYVFIPSKAFLLWQRQ